MQTPPRFLEDGVALLVCDCRKTLIVLAALRVEPPCRTFGKTSVPSPFSQQHVITVHLQYHCDVKGLRCLANIPFQAVGSCVLHCGSAGRATSAAAHCSMHDVLSDRQLILTDFTACNAFETPSLRAHSARSSDARDQQLADVARCIVPTLPAVPLSPTRLLRETGRGSGGGAARAARRVARQRCHASERPG